jgi:hypothetical protein
LNFNERPWVGGGIGGGAALEMISKEKAIR